jgi:hypothetical protein
MLRLPDGLSVDAFYDGHEGRAAYIVYRAKGALADTPHPDSRTWASCLTRPSTRSWRRSPRSSARRGPRGGAGRRARASSRV